jgi:hypothetical protein
VISGNEVAPRGLRVGCVALCGTTPAGAFATSARACKVIKPKQLSSGAPSEAAEQSLVNLPQHRKLDLDLIRLIMSISSSP